MSDHAKPDPDLLQRAETWARRWARDWTIVGPDQPNPLQPLMDEYDNRAKEIERLQQVIGDMALSVRGIGNAVAGMQAPIDQLQAITAPKRETTMQGDEWYANDPTPTPGTELEVGSETDRIRFIVGDNGWMYAYNNRNYKPCTLEFVHFWSPLRVITRTPPGTPRVQHRPRPDPSVFGPRVADAIRSAADKR